MHRERSAPVVGETHGLRRHVQAQTIEIAKTMARAIAMNAHSDLRSARFTGSTGSLASFAVPVEVPVLVADAVSPGTAAIETGLTFGCD